MKGGHLNCVRIRTIDDLRRQSGLDEMYRLWDRAERSEIDRETEQAWQQHDGAGRHRGKSKRR